MSPEYKCTTTTAPRRGPANCPFHILTLLFGRFTPGLLVIISLQWQSGILTHNLRQLLWGNCKVSRTGYNVSHEIFFFLNITHRWDSQHCCQICGSMKCSQNGEWWRNPCQERLWWAAWWFIDCTWLYPGYLVSQWCLLGSKVTSKWQICVMHFHYYSYNHTLRLKVPTSLIKNRGGFIQNDPVLSPIGSERIYRGSTWNHIHMEPRNVSIIIQNVTSNYWFKKKSSVQRKFSINWF